MSMNVQDEFCIFFPLILDSARKSTGLLLSFYEIFNKSVALDHFKYIILLRGT